MKKRIAAIATSDTRFRKPLLVDQEVDRRSAPHLYHPVAGGREEERLWGSLSCSAVHFSRRDVPLGYPRRSFGSAAVAKTR